MKDYVKVTLNGKHYYVCKYIKNGVNKLFVIDADDLPKILAISKTWFERDQYIGCDYRKNDVLKNCYIHNVIMKNNNKSLTVDHINKIKSDNRKENLRLLNQSQQNDNQSRRRRYADLPKSINRSDIPKCIWFDKSDNRQRFVIEI